MDADVGVIVALPKECAAMLRMVTLKEMIAPTLADPNFYYLADLETRSGGTYRVVIAQCPKMGNSGAAMVAKDLIRSFHVKHLLMVGIAAGVPNVKDPAKHVRLGDVVVSYGKGVVQYDMVKRLADGSLEIRSTLPPPSSVLLNAANTLEVERMAGARPWETYIHAAAQFAERPPAATDELTVCSAKGKTRWRRVPPPARTGPQSEPHIHYGLIGSGNCLLKDIQERDRLASACGVQALEMEGAGVADAVWNQTEVSDYLVIRGVADYADRRKSDLWQSYAALAAAAYAKALLEMQPFPPRVLADSYKRVTQSRLNAGDTHDARALDRYLRWLSAAMRDVTFRASEKVFSFPLTETFVSPEITDVGSGKVQAAIRNEEQGIDFLSLWPEAGATESRGKGDSGSVLRIADLLVGNSNMIILGAPGSGKSTIVQYVAHVLAESLLKGESLAQELLGSTGELPLPVYIPLNAFAHFLRHGPHAEASEKRTLLSFATYYLKVRQADLGLSEDFLSRFLLAGNAVILLLDGLDEITNEGDRVEVCRAIEDITRVPCPLTCIVTARPTAYHDATLLTPDFKTLTIRPMGIERIEALVRNVCERVYGDRTESIQRSSEILGSIRALESGRRSLGVGIGRLVDSPLMVRMIVTTYFRYGAISQRRSSVFRKYLDAIVDASYNNDPRIARRLATEGGEGGIQRRIFSQVAFSIHCQEKTGGLDCAIGENQCRDIAMAAFVNENCGHNLAEQFVAKAKERGGILEPCAGGFRFFHFAFQEYLTGQQMALSFAEAAELIAFLGEDDRIRKTWWRSPLVHCVEAIHDRNPEEALDFITLLLEWASQQEVVAPGTLVSCMIVLGEAAVETRMMPSAEKVISLGISNILFTRDVVEAGTTTQRAMLGRILNVFGDKREELAVEAPAVVEVSGGVFTMGNAVDTETTDMPSHHCGTYEVDIPTFRIGKFPITNGQYRQFIDTGGYTKRRFWTEFGWAWRCRNEITQPVYWDDAMWNLQNHPVVGVSWFEAHAYCKWLSETMNRYFRLPSEAEWEKSAAKQTRWPWGDDFDASYANTTECRVGRTTCVGIFPSAASPYGLFDVAGNVWEWCNSEYRPFGVYTASDGRESTDGMPPRCLRGGSWLNNRHRARVANCEHYYPGDRHFDVGFRIAES